ncbi:MAG: hypothetical protein QOI80_1700 [Solirubrobacteraceae bacterium]|jgi:uncharacterized protein|nr:hypothetical protein [Solirubrobacteraceae bacterium]
MPRTHVFELEPLALRSGEGRRFELEVPTSDLSYAGQRYHVTPEQVPVVLDVSRTTHAGYALRLRFRAQLSGPCMRCLEAAAPTLEVDAREVNVPGGGDELTSPYVDAASDLDVEGWARDALVLAVPDQILCKPDCAGLCPLCGENLNERPDHEHEREPDPRWAALRELKLD